MSTSQSWSSRYETSSCVSCAGSDLDGSSGRPDGVAAPQVLEERPGDAVDVMETALLVKKTGVDQRQAAPLVPPGVRAVLRLPARPAGRTCVRKGALWHVFCCPASHHSSMSSWEGC